MTGVASRLDPAHIGVMSTRLLPGVAASATLVLSRGSPPGMGCPASGLAMRLVPIAGAGLLLCVALSPGSARAEGQVQLSCRGTLIESRGEAELQRPLHRLAFSLQLEAQGRLADAALGQLQERLAVVRQALQRLEVEDFRATSPSTWMRSDSAGRPAGVQAQLQVSGRLAPERLNPLIRDVGALRGVQLSPVDARPDSAQALQIRRRLLQEAYQNALTKAQEVAEVIGRRQLQPLEVQLGTAEPVPMAMLERVRASVTPFNPAELAVPKDRLSLSARFCAR